MWWLLLIALIGVFGSALAKSTDNNNSPNFNLVLDNYTESETNVDYKINVGGTPFNVTLFYLQGPLENMILPNGADIETWVAPYDIPKNFVYYMSGYDDENRPIWIIEAGKWYVKGIIEDGHLTDFDLYVKQFIYRAIKSFRDKSTPDEPVSQVRFLIDWDHLKYDQIRHTQTLNYVLQLAREYQPLVGAHMGESTAINANYVAEILINLVRPIFGGIFERISIFGSNKVKWIPHVVRQFQKHNLPEWYGGSSDFKPLRVYG